MRYILMGLVGLGVMAGAGDLAAQVPEECSYEECALLRVDNDVLAGATRTPVASFGWFTPPDAALLGSRSEEALRLQQVTHENFTSGQIMGLVGAVAAVGGTLALQILDTPGNRPSSGEWIALGVGLTGTGLAFLGDRRVRRARRAFDEALWWHNATLVRPDR